PDLRSPTPPDTVFNQTLRTVDSERGVRVRGENNLVFGGFVRPVGRGKEHLCNGLTNTTGIVEASHYITP
ncbi:MAG: hypothetical protein AAGA62_07400, partial [Bacteroidota bacterium]